MMELVCICFRRTVSGSVEPVHFRIFSRCRDRVYGLEKCGRTNSKSHFNQWRGGRVQCRSLQSYVRWLNSIPRLHFLQGYSMAHSLRLKVIAEGVNAEEQQRLLRLLKCDEMQGYLFGKPRSMEDVEQMLQSPTRGSPNNCRWTTV